MGAYQTSIYISNLVNREEHTSQIPNTCSALCLWWWFRSGIISLISRDMLLFFDTNWSPSVIGSDKRLTFRARFYPSFGKSQRGFHHRLPACYWALKFCSLLFHYCPAVVLRCSGVALVLLLLCYSVIILLFSVGILSSITWVWFPCLFFVCDAGVVHWMLATPHQLYIK